MLGRGVKEKRVMETEVTHGHMDTQDKNKTATLSISTLNILILNLEGCNAECH
jgi:hypothetical protein